MEDIDKLALAQRGCGAGAAGASRIPTNAQPFYSVSKVATIAANQLEPDAANLAALTFVAERDTLFTDMSVQILDNAGQRVEGAVTVEYCNGGVLDDVDLDDLQPCCARKPIFLEGVKENKRLKITNLRAYVADAVNPYSVVVTYTGVQGNGCCT